MRAVVPTLLLVSATAYAGPKAKPIKAEMLCGTFVDGKIKEPLAAGKHAKITDPIACAIHVTDPNEPSHMGNVHTVRHAGGKNVVTSGKTDDFGSQSDADKKDFEVVMKPGEKDASGDIAFNTCEDFDIVGTIADDLGTYFTKTIKIQQTCPKPKPIAATAKCTQPDPDGKKPVVFGAKAKERWSSGEISCEVRSKDARLTDKSAKLVAVMTWIDFFGGDSGSEHVPKSDTKEGSIQEMPQVPAFQAVYLDPHDWAECSDVNIALSLVDGSGAKLWSQTFKTKHTCGE